MGWILAALAFAVLFFVPGLLQQFDVPKIAAVRVCGLGALAASLIAGRAGRPARWRPLDVAVVAWLAVEIVTTVASVSPRLSVLGEPRQREGLLTSLALAGIFFAARDAFAADRDPQGRRARATLGVLGALAAAACAYALAQVAGLDVMQWRREAVYAGEYVRPFATLGHPNLLGVLTAAAAVAALALAIAARRPAAGAAHAAVALVALVVTVLTLSRAAWLAAAVALPVAALLAVRERPRPGVIRLLVALLVVLAVTFALVNSMTRRSPVTARLVEATDGGSGASRLEIWRTAFAAFRARPLTGHGPDLFEQVFPHHQTADYWRHEWTGLPTHAHDVYLHTLATRGVLGLLAGLGWAVALAAAARQAWRARGRIAGTHGGVVPAALAVTTAVMVAGIFGALGITGALLVVLASAMIAGAADHAASAPATAETAPPPARRGRGRPHGAAPRAARPAPARLGPRRLVAGVAGVAVAALAFLWGFAELRASRAAAAAQAWMTTAPERAVPAAEVAVSLAPHEDRLWRMLALSLLWRSTTAGAGSDDVGEAEAAAQRAVSLEPGRAENRVILARALGAREGGNSQPALPEFERALALAPMDALTLMEFADYQALHGRGRAAVTPARKAVELYPDEGMTRATLARAWWAAGEPDSARAAIDLALRGVWRSEAARRDAEALRADLTAPASR